jgi:hypothetical protein
VYTSSLNGALTSARCCVSEQLLETGLDILFFWVARMVMMSLHLTNQLPFKTGECAPGTSRSIASTVYSWSTLCVL